MAGPDPKRRSSGTSASTLIGTRIGKYDITRALGRGGMGVVYAAHDPLLQREVAIKLLAETSDDPSATRRLLVEARRAARLSHPNVVSIYEIDSYAGGFFLVMELVNGASAQDLLDKARAMSWRKATAVAADICRGLIAAHSIGMIHRDIKPHNVLIASSGTAKLTDFGVAKADDAQSLTATAAGIAIGTPTYMSPEQCRSEPLDERSDLYSLGATYYALLTGRAPYDAPTAVQVMFAHCATPTPDPRKTLRGLPDACAAIVERAMAKSRTDRFAASAEMLAALEAILASEPLTRESDADAVSPGSGRNARMPSWITRRSVLIGASAVALAIPAAFLLRRMFSGSDAGPGTTPDDSRSSDQAAAGGASPQRTPARAPLPRPEPIMLHPSSVLPQQAGDLPCVRFSRDGAHMVTACSDGSAKLWSVPACEVLQTFFAHAGGVTAVAASADARVIATGGADNRVVLWNGQTGQLLHEMSLANVGRAYSLLFTHDARTLFIGGVSQMRAVEISAGRFQKDRFPPKRLYMGYAMALSPDGAVLACATWERKVLICDAASGKEWRTLTRFDEEPTSIAFATDGQRLAVGGGKGSLWMCSIASDRPPTLLNKRTDRITAVAFCGRDGTLVYSCDWGGPLRMIDLPRQPERPERAVPADATGLIRSMDVTLDGTRLVTSNEKGVLRLWDIARFRKQ